MVTWGWGSIKMLVGDDFVSKGVTSWVVRLVERVDDVSFSSWEGIVVDFPGEVTVVWMVVGTRVFFLETIFFFVLQNLFSHPMWNRFWTRKGWR